jgi:transcriptional regulator with XRE-family HTH domain
MSAPISLNVVDERKFFRALGARIKGLRKGQRYTQEDMISLGFSARHWQQIEAGRPITVRTLLKICDTFDIQAARLLVGLDRGIYKK